MNGVRGYRTIVALVLVTAWSCSLVACIPFPLTRKHASGPDEVSGSDTTLVKPVLAEKAEESSSEPGKETRASKAPAKRKPSAVTPLVTVQPRPESPPRPKTSKTASKKPADHKTKLIKPLITERPRERSSTADRKDRSKRGKPVERQIPLVKPKLSERPTDEASRAVRRKGAGEMRSTAPTGRGRDRAALTPPRRMARSSDRDYSKESHGRAPLIKAEIKDEQESRSAVKRTSKKEDRTASVHPSVKADREGSHIPSRTDTAKPASREFLFQKPDHVEYSNEIKNKAIDLTNREAHASLVQLCKDSITGEWSLTIYKKGRKTFSFVIYSWDPIDQQWHETLDSGKRPLSMWDHHIKFSRDGRHCDVLKRLRSRR
jgi:hypothetical protein